MEWLENVVREMVEIDPRSIAMEMIDENGSVSTCYYNTSQNDRSVMIDAMRDDDRFEWLANNREEIKSILFDDDDDVEDDNDGDDEDGVEGVNA